MHKKVERHAAIWHLFKAIITLSYNWKIEFIVLFLCQPENILCVSMDSNDIKLVDFGLARNLTTEDDIKSSFGTPDFVGEKVFRISRYYLTDNYLTVVNNYIKLL